MNRDRPACVEGRHALQAQDDRLRRGADTLEGFEQGLDDAEEDGPLIANTSTPAGSWSRCEASSASGFSLEVIVAPSLILAMNKDAPV